MFVTFIFSAFHLLLIISRLQQLEPPEISPQAAIKEEFAVSTNNQAAAILI
jgi:hypothetical protein